MHLAHATRIPTFVGLHLKHHILGHEICSTDYRTTLDVMDIQKAFQEVYLRELMDSSAGNELREALEATSADERRGLEEFKKMISHCQNQLAIIQSSISAKGPTKEIMCRKRAFEEEQTILNIAALTHQCNYETKAYQLLLYFEKNENIRAQIMGNVSVMMYEWCEKLLGISGKPLQNIAKRLLEQAGVIRINVARKKISDFFKRERQTLHDIRIIVGAHKDGDFMKQREVIDEMSWSDILTQFHDFEDATVEFGRALKPLMDAGLKQVSASFV